MKTIAIIPARGGSKSIPKKNIRLFNGKPLLYWSAKACQQADFIHQVIVATDSKEIEDISKSFGFNKLQIYSRSKASSTDTASTEQVLIEFIQIKYVYYVAYTMCQYKKNDELNLHVCLPSCDFF